MQICCYQLQIYLYVLLVSLYDLVAFEQATKSVWTERMQSPKLCKWLFLLYGIAAGLAVLVLFC